MANELDTSWFDLKNYEPLKTMSIKNWASVIESRAYINEIYDCQHNEEEHNLQSFADELKPGYFSTDLYVEAVIEEYESETSTNHSFSTSTVDSLRTSQAHEIADDPLPGLGWDDFYKMRNGRLKLLKENCKTEGGSLDVYDFRFKQYLNRDYIPSGAHVIIDLDAPDEQIKIDFANWLTSYRKESGYHVPKKKIHEKRFSQKTFDYWIEYGLIPYLDLTLIAKIEGKKILQRQMSDLIFPDPIGFTAIERLRDTTIPEATRLMEKAMRSSLIKQAAIENLMGRK